MNRERNENVHTCVYLQALEITSLGELFLEPLRRLWLFSSLSCLERSRSDERDDLDDSGDEETDDILGLVPPR